MNLEMNLGKESIHSVEMFDLKNGIESEKIVRSGMMIV